MSGKFREIKMKTIALLLLFIVGCSTQVTKEFEVTELNYPQELKVVKRKDWGWKPLTRTVPQHKIKYITLHHGGIEFKKDEDPVKYIRHLQDWSRAEKNWIDNPYHFMIDLNGVIYETRPINYPGDTNTKYNPVGHALICVMGNYEVQKMNKKQLRSVVKLSAFIAKKYGISADKIKGHKDYAETLCPGKDFYKYIKDGTIRNRINAILQSK
jgi:hypothetical protein